jgi:hypothetical protein
VLQGLRETLQAAGELILAPAENSFAREGTFLEHALKKALSDREEAIRELAAAGSRNVPLARDQISGKLIKLYSKPWRTRED